VPAAFSTRISVCVLTGLDALAIAALPVARSETATNATDAAAAKSTRRILPTYVPPFMSTERL
jgi:hypothetical protein